MVILGLNLSHDRAACLVIDGRIQVAIAEERLSRRKHDIPVEVNGERLRHCPMAAIDHCLAAAKLTLNDVDLVVASTAYVYNTRTGGRRELTVSDVVAQLPIHPERVRIAGHHLGHAASAAWCSGFEDAVIIVVDGGGGIVAYADDGMPSLFERTTFYRMRSRQLQLIGRTMGGPPAYGNSIGDFYADRRDAIRRDPLLPRSGHRRPLPGGLLHHAPLPLISVVMLTRNRVAFTRRALESLAATRAPLEWIVVDNGSSDGTREMLDEWGRANPSAQIVHNDVDPGSSHTRNQGLERARGELVLFLDNDVLLDDPLWLEKLAQPILDAGPVVATAPLLLFPGDGDIVQSAGGGVTSRGWVGLLGRSRPDGPEWATIRPLAWAPTAALLVRRDAALAAHGFDEAFDPVSIGEDIDLCCRLRAAGGEIVFVGAARLRHYEGITFNHLGYDKRAYWLRHMRVIRNRWLFVLTRGPLHSDDDIEWRPVIKDYSDLHHPRVHLPDTGSELEMLAQFFTPFLDASPEPPPPLRVGVAGCGQAAMRGALPAFSPPGSEEASRAVPFLHFDGTPNVILAAVYDIDHARASAAAREFGARRVEPSYEQLIANVPLEAICICSPPAFHAAQCIAAIANGTPVLVEKPPATSEKELAALLAAKRERGVTVMVNIPWLFHPALQAAREVVASGRLGTPRQIDLEFEHQGPRNWSPTAEWYFEGGLRTVILDLGLHAVLALEELTGAPATDIAPSPTESALHARAHCVVGDANASLSIGWDADAPRFSIRVSGSLASLELELIPWHQTPDEELRYDDVPFLGGPYRHFIDCVRSAKTPLTDLDRVAGAMRIVLCWAERA